MPVARMKRAASASGMTYTRTVFDREVASLEEAQRTKLELVCRKLELGRGDRLVEIGTGWGSLAIHAAKTRGCRVVTTKTSKRQLAHARHAVAEAGVADRVTVPDEDYRTLAERLRGSFDNWHPSRWSRRSATAACPAIPEPSPSCCGRTDER